MRERADDTRQHFRDHCVAMSTIVEEEAFRRTLRNLARLCDIEADLLARATARIRESWAVLNLPPTRPLHGMAQIMLREHLAQAERHVAEGAERIRQQRERIAKLARDGHATAESLALLHLFQQTQALHEQDLARIQAELAQTGLQDQAPTVPEAAEAGLTRHRQSQPETAVSGDQPTR